MLGLRLSGLKASNWTLVAVKLTLFSSYPDPPPCSEASWRSAFMKITPTSGTTLIGVLNSRSCMAKEVKETYLMKVSFLAIIWLATITFTSSMKCLGPKTPSIVLAP